MVLNKNLKVVMLFVKSSLRRNIPSGCNLVRHNQNGMVRMKRGVHGIPFLFRRMRFRLRFLLAVFTIGKLRKTVNPIISLSEVNGFYIAAKSRTTLLCDSLHIPSFSAMTKESV